MKTHWLQNPNKNYLGHWDLPESDLILTIESAKWEDVIDPTKKEGSKGYVQSKRIVRFVENYKPLICNETNAKAIYKSTGVKFLEDSKGARIALYVGLVRDRKLKVDVDCVRVRETKVGPAKTIEDYPNENALMDGCKTLTDLQTVYLGLSQDLQRLFFHKKEELKTKLK